MRSKTPALLHLCTHAPTNSLTQNAHNIYLTLNFEISGVKNEDTWTKLDADCYSGQAF